LSNKCLLSVAMIVKDEEHNIRRALESIKDVADEIIVVDTGSKDRTPEIVKEYTDKLYFHEWRNDFSEARNYSLKFPTCEWVLIFDADEEVSDKFRKGIKNFLESLPKDVNTVYLPTLSYLDWDLKKVETASTPRIFRNGTVSYKNIIHNQAVYKPKVVNANFPIIHYGYIWTRKLKEKKYNRTRSLIIEHLKSSKNPLDRLYYLVQLYKTEAIGGKVYQKNEVGWQILNELKSIKEVPGIVLEFLYLFGNECVKNGMFELGKQLFETTIKAYPDNPDPYLGLLILYDRKEDADKAIEIGEKFLDKVKRAQQNIEEFQWTIMAFKNMEHAYTILAKWYLKKKNFEKFNYYIKKMIENFKDIATAEQLLNALIIEITKDLEQKEEFEKILLALNQMIEYSSSNSLRVNYDLLIFKLAEVNVKLKKELIDKFKFNLPISKYIAKRFFNPEENYFLDFVLDEKNLENFVIQNSVEGLLLLYDFLMQKESEINVLRKLLKLRNIEDVKVKGIVFSLLGDLYLKLGNLKESISMYRKAIEILPELSMFIKPVVEDLKVRLDKDIEGTYDELVKYFSQSKEFIFDIISYVGEEQASKLYLISDHPLAIYSSAIATFKKDQDKALRLLKKIKEKDIEKLPFYYYRIAKLSEKENPEKAFEYHIKACEHNEKLADIKYGKYIYSGFYPSKKTEFFKDSDPTIWAGNISEKFSTLGIIHPIRCWKKGKKFIYCYPYPSDEALKVYHQRERDTIKTKPFKVKREDLLKVLAKLDLKDIKVYPEEDIEDYESVFEELNISVNQVSKNLLILSGVEEIEDISSVIKDFENIVIFFNTPDLKDREDKTWFYPPFRIFRTTAQLKNELKSLGFEIKSVNTLNKSLRIISAKRSGK